MRRVEAWPDPGLGVDVARKAESRPIPEEAAQDGSQEWKARDGALKAEPQHELETRGQKEKPSPEHPARLARSSQPRQEEFCITSKHHEDFSRSMMRAGAPTAIAPAGTSFNTTLLAPTFAPDAT